jgi:hypothetical protein
MTKKAVERVLLPRVSSTQIAPWARDTLPSKLFTLFYPWILSLTLNGKRAKIWLDHFIRVYIDNLNEFWWIYEFAGTI